MDWTQVIVAAAGLLFSAVVIPLVRAAIAWLQSKTDSEALRAAMEEAKAVADNVVASLQATVVDGLKAASADGKLDAAGAREVAKRAAAMFFSDLSARSLEALENSADDLAAYAGNLLEARLRALKEGK